MLLFLDIGGGEILLILVIVFLLFGPSKLPEMSRKLGKTMNELKKASNDIRREIQQGADEVTRDFKEAKQNIDQSSPLDGLEKKSQDSKKSNPAKDDKQVPDTDA
ncbi:MAG TPA: twin-arginine translocase TatA/TatE family subunit [Bacteroidales bacterium]|nr:twin-arginine translocase TatA/TatE family subunit [Bacteroidales bacterium]